MTILVSQRPAAVLAPANRFPSVRRSGRGLAGHVAGQGFGVLALAVDAGSTSEPAGAWGTALLLANLVDKGSRARSSEELALAAERLGASLFTSCERDGAMLGAQAPVAVLPAVAQLLAEAAWSPALPHDELATARTGILAELARRADEPAALAVDTFRREIWSEQSRYCVGNQGTAEAVTGTTRDSLLDFHQEHWTHGRATPVVTGDLSGIDVDEVLATLVAPGTDAAPLRRVPQTPAPGRRRIVVVDRPGAVQSQLLVGHPVDAASGAAEAPSILAAMPLCGLFGSRLNRLLREQRGVTYGVGGRFERHRDGGELLVSTAVRGDATAGSVRALVDGITQLWADGPTPDELEEARTAAIGSRAMRLRNTLGLHAHLVRVVEQDLPLDLEEQMDAALRGASIEQVAAAAREHLRPEELVVVVVGDAAAHVPALEALELGPVQVRTP